MDDVILYARLVLHILTFGWLVSYRCNSTEKAFVSILAAVFAGASLAAAAHLVLMRPEHHQIIALVITGIGCAAVVHSRGNLARIFQ